jgi:uncharacterized protein
MSSIDQQFVEFVVKSLVSKPDAVSVERRIDEKGVLLELTVDPEDLGRVIGKRGATAQSLRTLLRALGTKNDARYNLKIIDNGVPRPDRGYAPQDHSEPAEESAARSDSSEPEMDHHDHDEPAPEQPAEQEPQITEEAPTGEPEAEDEPEEQTGSDRIERTRKELEELDDFDV